MGFVGRKKSMGWLVKLFQRKSHFDFVTGNGLWRG